MLCVLCLLCVCVCKPLSCLPTLLLLHALRYVQSHLELAAVNIEVRVGHTNPVHPRHKRNVIVTILACKCQLQVLAADPHEGSASKRMGARGKASIV